MTCILAIDPGVTGALAFYLTDFPDRVSVLDMPLVNGEVNAAELSKLIRHGNIINELRPESNKNVTFRFAAKGDCD